MLRTANNNELNIKNVGEVHSLVGWCQKKRNLGGLVFIDLRDRYGITQLVVDPENPFYEVATGVKNEYVLLAKGEVVERVSKNPNLPTGEIEIKVSELTVLSTAEQPPFLIQDETDALEDLRMKYRYLDLRRPCMQKNFILRHKAAMSVRNYFDSLDFIEVETPVLGKSTPEGARDFLVPSRVHQGSFYALPQSPQMYKQLLMVSGFERYFQIVKCFRDEDLRADRQLEFTQIDVEMSFIDEEDIFEVIEGLLKKIWKDTLNMDIPTPFIRLPYDVCMNKYGSDKPDTRYELYLQEFSDWAKNVDFTIFKNNLENGGHVKGIVVPNASLKYTRKELDRLTEFAKKYHAKGLVWLKYENETLTGSIAKFLTEENIKTLVSEYHLNNGDLVLIVSDTLENCNFSLGGLRCLVAKEMGLIDESLFNFLWVVDWPLFEYDEEEQRYCAAHHPFTSPKAGDEDKLLTDPASCKAKAYDVVLNGYELGGGSIRIHNQETQQKMFKAIGLTDEQVQRQFSFFVNGLKYGTPPHGGLALGFDRLVMLLTGNNNLREIIAFPKAASAKCPMSEAPTPVDPKQLKELALEVKE